MGNGRPRIGRVERRASGGFFARILLKDGSTSSRIDLPNARDLDEARAMTTAMQRDEDATHSLYLAKTAPTKAIDVPRDMTCDAWWALYIESKDVGAGHRRVERSTWRKWISPVIGKLPMARLRPEDIERVRDRLDAAVAKGLLAGGTAQNYWATLTTAMTAATNAKDRAIRVHVPPFYERPVHTGILAPTDGRDRARPFLYPTEWLVLAGFFEVPARLRRAFAIALYTGLRPGELQVLTYDDIELDAGLVRVSKAWDTEAKGVKDTKTIGGHRVVPLQPAIRHLVERPPGVSGRALVVPELSERIGRFLAPTLRKALRDAGVRRARLFVSSATEIPLDFRALRDTYATWRGLQGAEAYVLRREMGHESLETTDRYIRLASTVRDATIGEPFPAFAPFAEGIDALGFSPALPPASPADGDETGENDGSDCRTRTCEADQDSQKSRENAPEGGSQNGPFGPFLPPFLLPPGASLAADPLPPVPAPGHRRGLEAGLYDIVDRADLARIQGLDEDDEGGS